MAYVERVDGDTAGSSGMWVIVGVVLAVLILMLMLAWAGIFGSQVQQVVPFYSGQTNTQPMMQNAPAPAAPGAPGAAGAPGAPGAAGAPAPSSPTTP